MNAVAVVWAPLSLVSPGRRGLAVGISGAAYYLPGLLAGVALTRRTRTLGARSLLLLDAGNRGVALIAIGLLHWAGVLNIGGYVALLAVASLLRTWGMAGRTVLVAGLAPPDMRLPANALLYGQAQAAFVLGPALAGVLTSLVGAPAVIGLNGLSFLVLFVATWGVTEPAPVRLAEPVQTPRKGFAVLFGHPGLARVAVLTFLFYLLYGPLEVALPLHAAGTLHGGAPLLGALWTGFGLGAVVGTLLGGRLPVDGRLTSMMAAMIAGWGAMVVLLGVATTGGVAMGAMILGGAIYAPYPAVTTTFLQEQSSADELPSISAAWSSLLLIATPLGTAVGGPIVTAVGPRATLVGSGLATLLLASAGAARRGRTALAGNRGDVGARHEGVRTVRPGRGYADEVNDVEPVTGASS